MKSSVTQSVKYIQDNLPVLVRGAFGIFDDILPQIKEGLKNKTNMSYALREHIEKGYSGLDDVVKELPISALLTCLSADAVKKTIRSFGKLSVDDRGFNDQDISVPVRRIRLMFTSNTEILHFHAYIPDIQVIPQVNFAFNTVQDNSGDSRYDYLPKLTGAISPTGAFSQVSGIDYNIIVDIDSLYKAYISRYEEESQEDLVNRIIGSACMTYFAAVSNSVGLYETALSELINPVASVLDEAFLEYGDVSDRCNSYDETAEPKWVRIAVSKVSAIFDTAIRGMGKYTNANNSTLGNSITNIIRAYFAKKYTVTNSLYTTIGDGKTIFTHKLSELMMDQVADPLIKSFLNDQLKDAREKGFHYIFRDCDEDTGIGVSRTNVVKMLQKTLILVGYSSVLINAASGLDRKYNQFNDVFGKRGGYKGMVIKMLSLVIDQLRDILKSIDYRDSDGDIYYGDAEKFIPLNRWKNATMSGKYLDYTTSMIKLWNMVQRAESDKCEEIIRVIADEMDLLNMSPIDIFTLGIDPNFDTLKESLRNLNELVKRAHMNVKDTTNDPTDSQHSGSFNEIELVRVINSAVDTKNYPDTSKHFTIESFEASLEAIEQLIATGEDAGGEMGSACYSPVLATVNQNVHGANELEDEAAMLQHLPSPESDPAVAEERYQYIQRVNKAVERFDQLLYKLMITK